MGNSLPSPKTDKLTRRGNITILETKKSTSSLSSFPIHKHRGHRHRDGGGQTTGKGSPHVGKREDREAANNHHYCRNHDGSVLPRCIEYALSSCQGWRIYQEDAYFYKEHFTYHGTNHHGGSQCYYCCCCCCSHHSLSGQDQESKVTTTTMMMNLQGHAIFGILDGHGGDYASKFVQEHFYSVFSTQSEYVAYCNLFLQLYPVDKKDDDVKEIRKKKSGKKKTTVCNKKVCNMMAEEEFYAKSMQLLKVALEKTFLQLDGLMLISMKEMHELTKDVEPGKGCKATRTENGYDLMDAGTAVLILIVTPHFIVCANAGDCRAMLLRCCGNNKQNNHGGRDAYEMGDFEVVPLSVDHKPYLQQEQERILKAGASVLGGKIDGILSLSRGLGDFNFKVQDNILENKNIERTGVDLRMDFTQSHPICRDLGCSQHTVSPMPEITIEKRDCDRDLYLLGASDGIWDVVSNEECANVVSTIFREGESDMGLVAEEIIDTCLKKGSQDNMTVVVAKFPSQKIGQGGGVLKRRKRRLAKEMGTL